MWHNSCYIVTLNHCSLGLRPNVIEIHLSDKDLRFISCLILGLRDWGRLMLPGLFLVHH